jgi:hypothetical protein
MLPFSPLQLPRVERRERRVALPSAIRLRRWTASGASRATIIQIMGPGPFELILVEPQNG